MTLTLFSLLKKFGGDKREPQARAVDAVDIRVGLLQPRTKLSHDSVNAQLVALLAFDIFQLSFCHFWISGYESFRQHLHVV